ncbi:hypothetical protein PENTCL1PPCAC_4327 [Pristionchus entomophagus]|uniref:Cystatin n=1 Tax=Pristionchus entomophagus TaxID=358040 RepID=A0AAV5SFM6_9BILA|nr:hypothetical protein PENTCL1PPCAC_4327 [Pristionchus entomophagus]
MILAYLVFLTAVHSLIWGNKFVEQNPRDRLFMQKVWTGAAVINAEPQEGLWHLIPVELMRVRTKVRNDGVYYQFDAFCRESTCARHKVSPAFVNQELCTERSSGWSYLIRLVLVEMPKNRSRYFVEDKQFLGMFQHY